MRWMCTNDDTMHNECYMSTMVKMPFPKFYIQQGIARLKELNDMSLCYPYLKCMKRSPASLARMDRPNSELEMCTLVLQMLRSSIVLAYFVYNGQHFPMELIRLEQDLMLVEMQEKQSHLME